LQGDGYTATQNELQAIDEAMTSLDAGEFCNRSGGRSRLREIPQKMKLVYSRQALADLDAIATYYSASASPAIVRSPRPVTDRGEVS